MGKKIAAYVPAFLYGAYQLLNWVASAYTLPDDLQDLWVKHLQAWWVSHMSSFSPVSWVLFSVSIACLVYVYWPTLCLLWKKLFMNNDKKEEKQPALAEDKKRDERYATVEIENAKNVTIGKIISRGFDKVLKTKNVEGFEVGEIDADKRKKSNDQS